MELWVKAELPTKHVDIMIQFFLWLTTIQNNPVAGTWCQSLMF